MPNSALIVFTAPYDGHIGSEIDAKHMEAFLQRQGFQLTLLGGQNATSRNVLAHLNAAAKETQPGEMFVFYYSGHGGSKPEHRREIDGKQELLCLYDPATGKVGGNGNLLDADLHPIWRRFQKETRILMLADCCHSGTNYGHDKEATGHGARKYYSSDFIDPNSDPTYCTREGVCTPPLNKIQAMMIHIGAARDYQLAQGGSGGLFTNAMLSTWEEWKGRGRTGNYRDFFVEVSKKVQQKNPTQIPQMNIIPQDGRTEAFVSQMPFTIPYMFYRPYAETSTSYNPTGRFIPQTMFAQPASKSRTVPYTSVTERSIDETPPEETSAYFCGRGNCVLL